MFRAPSDLLHGTLDVLILKSLSWQTMHGYAVARAIEERSKGVFLIEDAALYKALHRLEAAGSIDAEWGMSDSSRRAKFYSLTPKGRRQLTAESAAWRTYSAGVVRILDFA
jgi:PadR family transcriptional regulator, regulatory protein PadR